MEIVNWVYTSAARNYIYISYVESENVGSWEHSIQSCTCFLWANNKCSLESESQGPHYALNSGSRTDMFLHPSALVSLSVTWQRCLTFVTNTKLSAHPEQISHALILRDRVGKVQWWVLTREGTCVFHRVA